MLSAILSGEPNAGALELLISLQQEGPLVISAPVWAELAAVPGLKPSSIDVDRSAHRGRFRPAPRRLRAGLPSLRRLRPTPPGKRSAPTPRRRVCPEFAACQPAPNGVRGSLAVQRKTAHRVRSSEKMCCLRSWTF
ncbi:MAG: hypothetical protein K2X03_16535 [Bryobacteraceae bacterium]|nr:hypothetical protein [Bryobacteraceae bacterium]